MSIFDISKELLESAKNLLINEDFPPVKKKEDVSVSSEKKEDDDEELEDEEPKEKLSGDKEKIVINPDIRACVMQESIAHLENVLRRGPKAEADFINEYGLRITTELQRQGNIEVYQIDGDDGIPVTWMRIVDISGAYPNSSDNAPYNAVYGSENIIQETHKVDTNSYEYEEGEEASKRGKHLIHNPYPKGSQKYKNWNRGYEDQIRAHAGRGGNEAYYESIVEKYKEMLIESTDTIKSAKAKTEHDAEVYLKTQKIKFDKKESFDEGVLFRLHGEDVAIWFKTADQIVIV